MLSCATKSRHFSENFKTNRMNPIARKQVDKLYGGSGDEQRLPNFEMGYLVGEFFYFGLINIQSFPDGLNISKIGSAVKCRLTLMISSINIIWFDFFEDISDTGTILISSICCQMKWRLTFFVRQ